ncbi:MAG: hypothetical protein ABFR53_06385, partial [Actinomycetota bacterium]
MPDSSDERAGSWDEVRADAVRLIEQRDFSGAAERIASNGHGDAGGERDALLGLIHFHTEDYARAADLFATALETDGPNAEWEHMLAASTSNAAAQVHVEVPDARYFDRGELLAEPPPPSLPESKVPQPGGGLWRPIRHGIGHGIGSVGGAVMGWLTKLIGKNYNDEVWTNWYRKGLYSGILNLAYMRDKLNVGN